MKTCWNHVLSITAFCFLCTMSKGSLAAERVYPRVSYIRHGTDKRDVSEGNILSEARESSLLVIVIRTLNHTFYLELRPVQDVASSSLLSPWVSSGTNCLYRGEVISHSPGFAAVSLCQGENHMYGMWSAADAHYVLRPEGTVILQGLSSHSLRKLDPHRDKSGFCLSKRIPQDDNLNYTVQTNQESDSNSTTFDNSTAISESRPFNVSDNEIDENTRYRRASSDGAKYIETAIFADQQLWKKFEKKYKKSAEKELTNYILAVMNEVQTIYKYRSMLSNVNIVIQKLDILKDSVPSMASAGGEIDAYLDKFCAWQASQKSKKWDHAIMITGHNLYKTRKSNSQVIGQAWVEGMCLPKYSCTLNEGDDFEAAFVIAHEMGHNLGMVHDGDGNRCNANKDIMSSSTGAGKTQWSSCSNAALKTFLKSSQAKCLNNGAQPKSSLNYAKSGLPGQRYNLNTQCKLALGDIYIGYTSSSAPFNDPCRQTWCLNPRTAVANTTHPALEGTKCGDGGKMCEQGKCTNSGASYRRGNGKASKLKNKR